MVLAAAVPRARQTVGAKAAVVGRGRGHSERSACHTARRWGRAWVLGACAAAVVACAPGAGWQRTTARACDPGGPAVVCVRPEVDRGVTVEVGGATLVPGECARAPSSEGRARFDVQVRLAGGEQVARRVRARPGTMLVLDIEGDGEPEITTRQRCDGMVASAVVTATLAPADQG